MQKNMQKPGETGAINMKSQIATATKIIHAPAEMIYEILADYRTSHPRILPKPYFLSMDVEEGGFGAGTIVNFKMRILGQTRAFRTLITEPEPGRVLLETDLASDIATKFAVFSIRKRIRNTSHDNYRTAGTESSREFCGKDDVTKSLCTGT